MAEVVDGHRVLRCSFCAAAWELTTYACVYCGEAGEPFVTAAPDEERKDRRVEACGSCSGYLKTVDSFSLSQFPLLSIGDLETMDLDMAAMEHGYQRPAAQGFRDETLSARTSTLRARRPWMRPRPGTRAVDNYACRQTRRTGARYHPSGIGACERRGASE